ncbi:MAG: hypothetical protein KDB27_25335 [Planctomycetales bacterium]|nr:hypothetical protein [Planctomycetales bacterium]
MTLGKTSIIYQRSSCRGVLHAVATAMAWGAGVIGVATWDTSPAQAQFLSTQVYNFQQIRSDGAGGYKGPAYWVTGDSGAHQGDLSKMYQIEPPDGTFTTLNHLEVYSNAAGTSFWTSALRPVTPGDPDAGWNVGGESNLTLTKVYTKDAELGKLEFAIPKISLSAFGPVDVPTDNQGLLGHVRLELSARQGVFTDRGGVEWEFTGTEFDSFTAGATLTGWPTQYSCQLDTDSAPMNFGVTQGGTGEQTIECGLKSAFNYVVDLSDIEPGTDILISYKISTTAIDTIQTDTIVEAFGRDPTNPDGGIQITSEGLTPISLPVVPVEQTAVILSPAAITDSNLGTFSGDVQLLNAIDQSGLSQNFVSGVTSFDDFLTDNVPRADDDYRHYWQSSPSLDGTFSGAIDFDLGDIQSIDRLALWNGTLKDISVEVSESADGPWQEVGQFTLTDKNPLLYPLVDADVLELGATYDARYVRLNVDSAHPTFRGEQFTYAILRELAVSALMSTDGLLGDFNQNGQLDANDIDLLTSHIRDSTFDIQFDVNFDGQVNATDLETWIRDLKETSYGDSNLDGLFDSSDLVDVFQVGEYEDGVPLNSTWAEGDWDGNGEFDTGDLVKAFQLGSYEAAAELQPVPEPAASQLWLMALIGAALVVSVRVDRRCC